jgi:hypothetical protein
MYELIQNGDYQALGQYVVIRVAITMVCWSFMVVATLVDFWSGVTTARALHEPLMSHGFRRTIAKIGSYWQVLIFALLFDILGAFISFYYLPFMTMISTLSIIIIEARSVVENNRRRKVSAAQIPEVTEQIIAAMTNEEAVAALTRILELSKRTDKHAQ